MASSQILQGPVTKDQAKYDSLKVNYFFTKRLFTASHHVLCTIAVHHRGRAQEKDLRVTFDQNLTLRSLSSQKLRLRKEVRP